ncbi:hypothetical protein Fmac_026326 [Flemingia macrophylla]|uniref:YLP motif-containing protein 1 n=1 Tax=Flemingia macrophylla TaxID=520843 RepID=A0ABD1LEN2_9FABA
MCNQPDYTIISISYQVIALPKINPLCSSQNFPNLSSKHILINLGTKIGPTSTFKISSSSSYLKQVIGLARRGVLIPVSHHIFGRELAVKAVAINESMNRLGGRGRGASFAITAPTPLISHLSLLTTPISMQHHLTIPIPIPIPTTTSTLLDSSALRLRLRLTLLSLPPPPAAASPGAPLNQFNTYFSPPSLFPLPPSSAPEPRSLPQPYYHAKPPPPPLPEYPAAFPSDDPSKHYLRDSQSFSLNRFSADRAKFVDASQLFRHPHRASRPDHFVIIFRGLPGSGKSYLAKMLRDLEVENGGDAPRIHSMDDYFMTEVEKVEDSEASKSSTSGRNKKPGTKKVMEYCYEPEMEEAYRSSMLKSFRKTVEEGVFTFIIVDDRNLRVADFAQFWATAKRSGYEVYILEATYKDPAGCAARNVHGFTQEDIEKMSKQWEEAPSLYLQLDVKSLFHGDDLKESRIQEVDMDMEDDMGGALPPVQAREAEKVADSAVGEDASLLKAGKSWDAEGAHPTEVRELGKSKWSEDFGEDDIDQNEGMKGNINALSGLIHQYGKQRKPVHWGDQGGKTGFSIGAARKVNALSLVIGPGAGYNLKSNPLPEEDSPTRNSVESKKHNIFQERIRAEHESFKAVFDRRRQRIGGLGVEED